MLKLLILLFSFASVHGQVVDKDVLVINYKEYMIDVIKEVLKRVEEKGWWNLPVPGFDHDYDENLITWQLKGNVKYTNAFVASIQKISIEEDSLKQVWTSANGVKVEMRGRLMIEDVAIGSDIVSNLTEGVQRHTGLINYPLATFDFSVFRDALTHYMTVAVSGNLESTKEEITILPMDKTADVLVMLFDSRSFNAGVSDWGPAVFQPLAEHIVKTEAVKFPGLCYDCPEPGLNGRDNA